MCPFAFMRNLSSLPEGAHGPASMGCVAGPTGISGILEMSVAGCLLRGNRDWFRRTLRRRQIPCYRVLGAHVVDHDLKQHGILAAVELKRLVQAFVLLFIRLVVGKDGDGELAPLRVGFLRSEEHTSYLLLQPFHQRELVVVAVAFVLQN